MEALIGIGGVFVIVVLFAGLSAINRRQTRRMVADATRSSTRSFQFLGDLLPREETSLGPVDYRRIPAAEADGYYQTTQTAKHAPTIETSFIVPALTATGTAIALTIATGALAWAFGWPGKTVLIVFALSLALGWFWRLGFADKVLWAVESWSGKDLDHDGRTGNPALAFGTINPGRARTAVAQQAAQTSTAARTAALQTFVDVCYLHGTSEGAHGILASGPDRDNYVACRDVLFTLGLAAWKNPERPRGGWQMTADPATCKTLVAAHIG